MGHCAPEGSVVPQEGLKQGIGIGFMQAGTWRAFGVQDQGREDWLEGVGVIQALGLRWASAETREMGLNR